MEIFRENKKVDRLTGLLNMNAFYEKAQEMLLDSAIKCQHPSCIVVFDILSLREINRTIGREEEDARIITLTETIRAKMPQQSLIFRGHEAELIVVTSHYDEKDMTAKQGKDLILQIDSIPWFKTNVKIYPKTAKFCLISFVLMVSKRSVRNMAGC